LKTSQPPKVALQNSPSDLSLLFVSHNVNWNNVGPERMELTSAQELTSNQNRILQTPAVVNSIMTEVPLQCCDSPESSHNLQHANRVSPATVPHTLQPSSSHYLFCTTCGTYWYITDSNATPQKSNGLLVALCSRNSSSMKHLQLLGQSIRGSAQWPSNLCQYMPPTGVHPKMALTQECRLDPAPTRMTGSPKLS
jgi:hypothetical protein